MTTQDNIDNIIRPIRADVILAKIGLSLIGACQRWRERRRIRAAVRDFEHTLQTYPDYLLKDMGFVPSGRVHCAERMNYRF